MVLLAVDTSGSTSVALVADDGTPVDDASSDDPRGHAETIGPLLHRVLDGVDRAAVTAVAYGTGPGPYTGLRVGMAAARAAAFALGAVELPVLSHDAAALRALDAGAVLPFVVVADAKRHELFFTVYREIDGAGLPARSGESSVGAADRLPTLQRVDGTARAASIGRVAVLRRAAGIAAERPAAQYLRSPDVTLAVPRRVLA